MYTQQRRENVVILNNGIQHQKLFFKYFKRAKYYIEGFILQIYNRTI